MILDMQARVARGEPDARTITAMRKAFLLAVLVAASGIGGAQARSGNRDVLKTIHFFVGSTQLRTLSIPKLDSAAAALKTRFPAERIEIAGHSDEKGSEEYNFDLSRRRAQVVMDYLLQKGISPDRMFIKGYGAELPVADNQSERGREQNRRVELRFAHEPGPGDFH